MIIDEISWNIMFRGVIPFGSANIFLMVLIYFTLARFRLGTSYPYYATFIVCFIIFLLGPLINMMQVDSIKHAYDITRNILLFAIGVPCLLLGLLTQSKVVISKAMIILPFVFGFMWSIFFVLTMPLYAISQNSMNQQTLPELLQIERINPELAYYSQAVLITLLLIIPSIIMLQKKLDKYVVVHIYGVLTLCFFMCIGNIFKQWEIYYAGSSLTALVWGWAVYRDILLTHQKLHQHSQYQRALAQAQFSASAKTSFTEYYPDKLNESYPFRDREALLEAVFTHSTGFIKQRTDNLLAALKTFTQNQVDTYQIRAKEILFMLFDSVIFQGNTVNNNIKSLLQQLEQQGQNIEKAPSIEDIDNIIFEQAYLLSQLKNKEPQNEADAALIDSIKQYILGHYDSNISINDVISVVGASRSHIMKTFKTVTSKTINQYLTDVRIGKAKSLLLTQSITETAYDVGFNNSAYFSTVFKQQVGITPKAFQQNSKLGI
ncbi:AraC family transcriptional regulator [Colwellia sp. E2M01]|uniref:helix-turn-helix transcriptional regulator n=1 Tax=Colwellia sp. E2M01 TaxID=2841561 RepID=UPI001C0959C5|nr:AraC family transcriptional regulator [Colwellia sp. E2M01]MBU2870738.1 AraC family transcriptional regulator [Colwellia sp. E2M01]